MRRCALLLLCAVSLHANTTFYVTVAGLGGEPEYSERFMNWATELDKIVKAAGPGTKAETLSGNAATRSRIQSLFAQLSHEAKAEDVLVLMMIGHGTFDGTDYKFNLPGPDVTAVELASLLDHFPARKQLVVNMTSASGASRGALQSPTRAVITATKAGTEKNATVFTRYWVEALRDPAADSDKNESISAAEAFQYAQSKTAKFFEQQKRLATEHAAIDNPLIARTAVLRLGSLQEEAKKPEKQKLIAQKEELEGQIDQLKYEKAAMQPDQYRKQLSALLLELARTQAEIDK